MRRTVQLVTALVCASAAALHGCGPRFGRIEPREGDIPADMSFPSAPAVVQGFEPARVRIHPLSRFEGAGDTRRVVVDVELLDAFGSGVKWPGLLRVESAPGDSFEGATSRWLDLTSPEANAGAFDGISRCYPVRLPAPGTGPVSVRVRWMQANAEGSIVTMEASLQVTAGK